MERAGIEPVTSGLQNGRRPRHFTGSWAWLLTRNYPAYDSAYPGLAAKIHRGWVTAFRIRYPAGGD
jgi:hypothetical protein